MKHVVFTQTPGGPPVHLCEVSLADVPNNLGPAPKIPEVPACKPCMELMAAVVNRDTILESIEDLLDR